jgi:thiamine-phosphate pyrophosphorylase
MAKNQPLRSQIYLMVEAGLDPNALSLTLDAGAVACVLLRSAGVGDEALRAAIAALRPIAHEREVAFLVEDQAELVNETGCDGVHLSKDSMTVKNAREVVGSDVIVGTYCGASRHAAMAAAEAGADYVALGGGAAERWWEKAADPEILTWWQAIMTAPCVAIVGDDLQTAGEMAAAGADFVAVGACIWSHRGGPDTAIREVLGVLGDGEAESNASQAKDV